MSLAFLHQTMQKQPPVVILHQATFHNIFILCLWLRIKRRSDQGVQFMNFPSQILIMVMSSYIEEKLFVAASALSLCSTCKASVFSEINPVPPFFFHLKSFLWKSPLTVRVRKKFINQISSYISFCFVIRAHLGHLFRIT